jgi:transcriptional regulator with XRE-family HTH domain
VRRAVPLVDKESGTLLKAPEVDVREVRTKMGLSQAQFALSAPTLRNWEQGRSRQDAPTRVLVAVIAKHAATVEGVLPTSAGNGVATSDHETRFAAAACSCRL